VFVENVDFTDVQIVEFCFSLIHWFWLLIERPLYHIISYHIKPRLWEYEERSRR